MALLCRRGCSWDHMRRHFGALVEEAALWLLMRQNWEVLLGWRGCSVKVYERPLGALFRCRVCSVRVYKTALEGLACLTKLLSSWLKRQLWEGIWDDTMRLCLLDEAGTEDISDITLSPYLTEETDQQSASVTLLRSLAFQRAYETVLKGLAS